MKKMLTLLPVLLLGLLLLPGYSTPDLPEADAAGPKFKYSKKVNDIVQNKCYGCHSPQGRSDKAKEKLMWDDLPGLSPQEQSEKLESIQHVLEEGAMPPARFLEGNPDKKLTDKEAATMKKWAEKMTKKAGK